VPPPSAPTAHRVRAVLAIPAFRRLWLVTSVAGVCDWMSLLALSALATQLTSGYQAQSFALGGVVATKLLPPLLLGPIAGALADKFDRRRVMVICDLLRCALFVSIPLVGTLWWLLVATLLIEMCALFWIPAKDAAVPNLLRRPDQMETAGQLALVMTYGVSVITAAGLFALLSRGGAILGASALDTVYVAVLLSGAAYLVIALTVILRIPEISGRSGARPATPGVLALIRDGAAFVARTPLVRGLVIGIIGAFAAGGIVIGSATLYAQSLGGGNAAYGVLFASVFIGLALGMGAAPQMARRIPHNRLFGAGIVAAGLALVLVALAPHLFLAIAAVMLVGGFAGIAFLTGLTIIGTEVADEIRGRVNAFVQTIVRLTLLGSLSIVPLIVGLVATRTIGPVTIDGTRVVMFAGGLVAAAVGSIAYRQMDDRRTAPMLPDLLAALRRGEPRRGSGLLVAVEGIGAEEAADQAARLAARLRAEGHTVVALEGGAADRERWAAALREASLSGSRARALAAAAILADQVERVVRPALAAGALVVADRFLAVPLAQFGVAMEGVAPGELEGLAVWATGRLRPDVSVLLDRAPADGPRAASGLAGEEHVRVRRLLTHMAAAEPHRYVVVDADGPAEEVAERIAVGLAPLLPPAPGAEPATTPTPRPVPAFGSASAPTPRATPAFESATAATPRPAPAFESATAPTPRPAFDAATVRVAAAVVRPSAGPAATEYGPSERRRPGGGPASPAPGTTPASQPDRPRATEHAPLGDVPAPGAPRSAADTGPIRRAASTDAARSAADTAPLSAVHPPPEAPTTRDESERSPSSAPEAP
jgi:dTMP kinase